MQKRVKEPAVRSEGEDNSAVIPVIVAAVEAYEQSFGREVKKVAVERVVYPRKEDRISFWKLRGRVSQMLERRGMIKKFKVRVDGKEYSVEVESVEVEKGLEKTTRTINPSRRKNTSRSEEASCRASTFSNKG